MRHCNIAPLHQLGICHNNVTLLYVCMYVYACIHVCLYGGALSDRSKSKSKSKSCQIRLEFPTGVKGWLLVRGHQPAAGCRRL